MAESADRLLAIAPADFAAGRPIAPALRFFINFIQ